MRKILKNPPMKRHFIIMNLLLMCFLVMNLNAQIQPGVRENYYKQNEKNKEAILNDVKSVQPSETNSPVSTHQTTIPPVSPGSVENADPFVMNNKQLIGSITCLNTYYFPGQTQDLTFHMSINSPDWEYGYGFYILFPPGFTVNSADTIVGLGTGDVYPVVNVDSLSYGTFYYSNSGGGPLFEFDFTVNVTVDIATSGVQTGSYFAWGDNYGAPPHNFSGTYSLNPSIPDIELKGIANIRTGVNLSSDENIEIRLNNLSAYDFTNPFDITFIVDGGTPVVESYALGLAPSASNVDYTSLATFDFSASGAHSIEVFISSPDDIISTNDTINLIVYNCLKSGDLLYSNGPLVSHPMDGLGGTDRSTVDLGLGMGSLGFAHYVSANYRVADEIEIIDPLGWDIYGFSFFGYQTGGVIGSSSMTHYNLRIWDGEPGNGGTIIWGDSLTNVLACTNWSNIYRVSSGTPTATNRPIMRSEVEFSPIHLDAGTYWIDWQTAGSVASGPWVAPITIVGQTTTGNAKQSSDNGNTWVVLNDGGSLTPQGLPFEVYGKIVTPVNDSCHQAIAINCGDTISGTTLSATLDENVTDCFTTYNTPGVWYSYTGNGQWIDLDLCSYADYDTKLFVFTGTCGNYTCVAGNDDYCGLLSGVGFLSDIGVEYYILVGGFGGATGNFELAVNCKDTCLMFPVVDLFPTMTDVTVTLTNTGAVTSFDVELVLDGTTFTGIPTHTSLSNPLYIDALTPDTKYSLMFRGECSPGNYTGWFGPYNFNTFCYSYDHSSLAYLDGYYSMAIGADSILFAEDFSIPANECWEMNSFVVNYFSMDFDTLGFAIFEDNAGLPGTKLLQENIASFDTVYTGSFFGYPTYEVEVTMANPLTLCGGATGSVFWISTWENSLTADSYWESLPDSVGNEPVVKDPTAFFIPCTDWTSAQSCLGIPLVTFSLQIIFGDIVDPIFDFCPNDTTIYVESPTGTVVNYTEPLASDNCYFILAQTTGLSSGSNFPVGVTTNTYEAVDSDNNMAQCIFNVTVVDITSVDEFEGELFDLYPNPSDGLFFISFVKNTAYSLQIYTPEGALVYQRIVNEPLKEDVIDIQHLSKGLYYSNVTVGDQVFVRKLMIQ